MRLRRVTATDGKFERVGTNVVNVFRSSNDGQQANLIICGFKEGQTSTRWNDFLAYA